MGASISSTATHEQGFSLESCTSSLHAVVTTRARLWVNFCNRMRYSFVYGAPPDPTLILRTEEKLPHNPICRCGHEEL